MRAGLSNACLGRWLTCRRLPLRAVSLLAEVRARHPGPLEIGWILHPGGYGEPVPAIRHREPIEVLGNRGFVAVRYAVAAEPAAAEVRGDDRQRAADRRRTAAAALTRQRRHPLGLRES